MPDGYKHDVQLALFSKENRKDFYYYNDAITDKNFAKATNRLVPGRTYTAKIFGINQSVSSEDCLAFLETQNAMLVGAQGISLVWEYRKEEFPISKYTVSFDKKDALWKVAVGYLRVPGVYRSSGGGWCFYLAYFGFAWHDAYCLLCLRDLE